MATTDRTGTATRCVVHEVPSGWRGFTDEQRTTIGKMVGTKDPALCAQRLEAVEALTRMAHLVKNGQIPGVARAQSGMPVLLSSGDPHQGPLKLGEHKGELGRNAAKAKDLAIFLSEAPMVVQAALVASLRGRLDSATALRPNEVARTVKREIEKLTGDLMQLADALKGIANSPARPGPRVTPTNQASRFLVLELGRLWKNWKGTGWPSLSNPKFDRLVDTCTGTYGADSKTVHHIVEETYRRNQPVKS